MPGMRAGIPQRGKRQVEKWSLKRMGDGYDQEESQPETQDCHLMANPPMSIVWNDSLSLGIPQGDAEHQRSIMLMDELNDAISGGRPKEVILELLREIVADATRHFRHEERLFAQYHYADAEHHSQWHSDILITLDEILEDFEHEKVSSEWIASGMLIKQTLMTHMLEHDTKFRD